MLVFHTPTLSSKVNYNLSLHTIEAAEYTVGVSTMESGWHIRKYEVLAAATFPAVNNLSEKGQVFLSCNLI